MVSLAFVVFDTFLILSWNLETILDQERNMVGMEVFLAGELTEGQGRNIADVISGMDGVLSVYYVSPAEAEALFRADLPSHTDLLDMMGSSFRLPASIQVVFSRGAVSSGRLHEISRSAAAIAGVERTVHGEDFMPGLVRTVNTIRRLVLLLGIVLVFSISMVVFYTVRLSVVRRALTVEIMGIVGAPWWFIRLPFVVEGVVVGSAGSAGGLLLTAALSALLSPAVSHGFLPVSWMTMVLMLGAVTGTIGALAGSYEKERQR